MIGVYDSGHGGLTVFRALLDRFPSYSFIYLGDHAHAPYGNKNSEDIVALTKMGVEALFQRGATLVILACNTATAVACRTLQQDWLPHSKWKSLNLLGIIAPTVEAATQTPWAISTPQYPQKFNDDLIAIFGTKTTISSGVFIEEIAKRCPKVKVLQQACPDLAGAIEAGQSPVELSRLVQTYVTKLFKQTGGAAPDKVILGCTHYPLVKDLFAKHFPAQTKFLLQANVVADSLEHYLERHPSYIGETNTPTTANRFSLFTSGDPIRHSELNQLFWPDAPSFQKL